jgi:hypothetical protein
MHLAGTPFDQLPEVLATGTSDAGLNFLSLSSRDPDGRDADYIAWHSLDHRTEQYRLAGLRNAIPAGFDPGVPRGQGSQCGTL